MSEQSARERPDGKVSETESIAANEPAESASADSMPTAGQRPSRRLRRPAAFRRSPASARNLSLLGIALLVIGGTAYFAVPAWSGTSAESPGPQALPARMHPSPTSTLPGPMPGAPTQSPTASAMPTPSVGPHHYVQITPTALRPSNPGLAKTWKSGKGGKALAAVTTLADNTLLAQQTGQYAIMLLDCESLEPAVRQAIRATLIPDIAMQGKYATALLSLKLAAVGCVAAIQQVPDGVEDTVTHVNQTAMALVATELSSGVSELFTATENFRQQ
jgi:hypothetical protein